MTRVLVVDDSSIDQIMAGTLLEKCGWLIDYASDGQEGLDAIRQDPPDLVLTDMQMPELDGLQLACTVRREFPNVPVVLMTARGSEEIALEALQAGAASYVPKRVMANRLVETVKRVLSARYDDQVHRDVFRQLIERVESFSLENNIEHLLSLSRHLQMSLAQHWGIDLSTRMQICQALEESLLNALYHGNLGLDPALKASDEAEYYAEAERRLRMAPYCDRRIDVEIQLTPDTVRYSIIDHGKGFDISTLPVEAVIEDLDRPCGRGIMLMRTFMDEVVYNDRGNQVTLVKHNTN